MGLENDARTTDASPTCSTSCISMGSRWWMPGSWWRHPKCIMENQGKVSLIGVNELTDCFGFQTSLWELFTILPYRGDKRIYNFAEVKKIIEDSESEYRIISDAKIQGRTIMEILEAYKILHEYYPENTLESLYREKKFDNSETDTIKKHEFHASLLGEKAFNIKHDAKEQKRLREAATAFRKLYNEERWRR